MKLTAFVLFLGLALGNCLASDVPELKAILARYDQTKFAQDEALREKFVMDLAALRWTLAVQDNEGWQDVDSELRRHPAPPNTDAFLKARLGKWLSPRHDYLYRADGTWVMDPDAGDADSTHGTWSIKGNQYFESVERLAEAGRAYTIILLDAGNFIYAQGNTTFYEKRPGTVGLPLRRD
jgi:hypothetical protein